MSDTNIKGRRQFMKELSLSAAGILAMNNLSAFAPSAEVGAFVNKVSVFSKNLQWLDYDGMAATAKEIGFNGIDLTVRPNGHVAPERVAMDLPKAVGAIRKRGIDVISVTTAISDVADPFAVETISLLRDLGIHYYRLNWFPYDQIASMDENLLRMKTRMEKLAKLNETYGVHGAYQNHSGESFGASVWDLAQVLKDLDPQYIGCQFDVRHAVVEGAHSWVNDFKIIQPWIKTVNVKDFVWSKRGDKWEDESVPLGEGMVDFKKYFELLRLYDIKAPICIHYEYPLGGADQGAKNISMPKEKVVEAMKKDLLQLRTWLQ
jgi:L-ribulose-5-phosphate 3-epimerase